MQTFLPYSDIAHSLSCLDDKRLGKQRVEAMQILMCIRFPGVYQWGNHPAVKMWEQSPRMLQAYYNRSLHEWKERGFQNDKLFMTNLFSDLPYEFPDWWGDEDFHAAHRSQLLNKDFEHYSQFGWKEEPGKLPYIWPGKILQR